MDTLFLIPARGGSKGIPGKNIKHLYGKPLILYTIETARELAEDADICVSTDSDEIISVVKGTGLDVPFVRPAVLSSDTANSRDVINHALSFFMERGKLYEKVVLLQPTSPFRITSDIKHMISRLTKPLDMVVSVRQVHDNPYYNLFSEDKHGFLKATEPTSYTRRQDMPKFYAYNGSAYVIQSNSIMKKNFSDFDRVVKYEMDNIHSIDIDTPFDWMVAEMIMEKKLWNQ